MSNTSNILTTPIPPDLRDPVGIGLRSPHYQEILDETPPIGWFEIHPENYFCGGLHQYILDQVAEKYPLSMHAVGLSLGADQDVDPEHLRQFKKLIDRYDPFLISDHIAWSASGNAHLNDLLPLPYTEECLERVCKNIEQVQDAFDCHILVENPSTYLAFNKNEMSEPEFMNEVCARTGCGMILDINNIYVQSHNHGINPTNYINNIDMRHVGEFHLAGHIEKEIGDNSLLIDTHNQTVCDDVWALYDYTLLKAGARPTLIEWDQDFPALQVLLDEAKKARTAIERTDKPFQDNHYAVG